MTKNGKLSKSEYQTFAKTAKILNIAQVRGIRKYEETKSTVRFNICTAHVNSDIFLKLNNGAWGVNTKYLKPSEIKTEAENRRAWNDDFCMDFKGEITETTTTLFSEESKFIL